MFIGLPNLSLLPQGQVLASAPPFVFMLDNMTAVPSMAWSYRKLKSAYSGECVNVRRDYDNTAMDIGFVNNILDTATLLSFCTVSGADPTGNGYVVANYDQTGNGCTTYQATGSLQPQIVSNGALVTLPTSNVVASSLQNNCYMNYTCTVNQPLTIACVFNFPSFSAVSSGPFSDGAGGGGRVYVGWYPNGAGYIIYAGSDTTGVGAYPGNNTNNTFVAQCDSLSGANSFIKVNGSAVGTGINSGSGYMAAQYLGLGNGTYFNGFMPEWIIFSQDLDSTDLSFMQSNQKSYYSTQ